MIEVSVKNFKLFEVIDEESCETFCGGWQEWYRAWWQRLSGCGPTVVTNIMNYLLRSRENTADCLPTSKSDFQALMQEVWQYVTPSVRGIPTTAALMKGISAYSAYKGLDLTPVEMDVPKNKLMRRGFPELLSFIAATLEADTPVAFLSLDKGEEDLLDSWHWVTLLSLHYTLDGSFAEADVADEGRLVHVDLRKWYDTTSLGGGFVRLARNG